MKLVATMPLRNEAWIVGMSARIVLQWCDALVVLLHASTDRTAEILLEVAQEHPGRVFLIAESGSVWKEMDHRQRLLDAARSIGATHIAITDADEVLTANHLPTVRDRIESLLPGKYLQAGMPCMWRGLDQFRIDGRIWADRQDLVIAFADRPDLNWQPVNGYDHHHRAPLNCQPSRKVLLPGGVMHLQWASWRRLTAKQAWYQMHERLRYPNKPVADIARLYAYAPDERGLRTAPAPESWWAPYQDLRKYVDLDCEPWHEAECRRLLAEHGAAKFSGLNLHGVADR